MEKTCAYCNKPFEGKGRGLYCSRTHRELAYRKRNGKPLTPFKSQPIGQSAIYERKIAHLQQQNNSLLSYLKEAVPIVGMCSEGQLTNELLLQAKSFMERLSKIQKK